MSFAIQAFSVFAIIYSYVLTELFYNIQAYFQEIRKRSSFLGVFLQETIRCQRNMMAKK